MTTNSNALSQMRGAMKLAEEKLSKPYIDMARALAETDLSIMPANLAPWLMEVRTAISTKMGEVPPEVKDDSRAMTDFETAILTAGLTAEAMFEVAVFHAVILKERELTDKVANEILSGVAKPTETDGK